MAHIKDVQTKLRCLRRELRLREKVYPRWVIVGQMRQDQADHEIALMRALVDDFAVLAEEQEPQLKLC